MSHTSRLHRTTPRLGRALGTGLLALALPLAVLPAAHAAGPTAPSVVALGAPAGPGAVTNIVVTYSPQGSTASWNPAEGATGYNVLLHDVSEDSEVGHEQSTDDPEIELSRFSAALQPGRQYRLAVQPHDADYVYGDIERLTFTLPVDEAPNANCTLSPSTIWRNGFVEVACTDVKDDFDDFFELQVHWGDGSPTDGLYQGQIRHTFNRPGSYAPKVVMKDSLDQVRTIELGAVTVLDDTSKPVVSIARPVKKKAAKVSSWKVVRGTVTDTGSGADVVDLSAVQKRGKFWYAFDGAKGKWSKAGKTQASAQARAVPTTTWLGGRSNTFAVSLKGLGKGKLVLTHGAMDGSWNISSGSLTVNLTKK